jgi:hypothetical protein
MRQQVRERANFACEYCGVTETDAGGELTVDHYQPQSKGGADVLENLIYCCIRCNQYKADYWTDDSSAPSLWNPRTESFEEHFLTLIDGNLHPLTDISRFTIRLLRLNRLQLVEHRLRHRHQTELSRLLERRNESIKLFEGLVKQQMAIIKEQSDLLKEQDRLLRLLLKQTEQ